MKRDAAVIREQGRMLAMVFFFSFWLIRKNGFLFEKFSVILEFDVFAIKTRFVNKMRNAGVERKKIAR